MTPDRSAVITVEVRPRAGRAGIDVLEAGRVRVRVTAPPVAGEANEAVCAVLAASLGRPRRDVRIVRGAAARTKLVRVSGLSGAEVAARLASPSRGTVRSGGDR
jgi:hypothetical protein